MTTQVPLSLRGLAGNAWVVGGLLLLAVGAGDLSVARSKLAQYHEVLDARPLAPPRDPAVLFPKPTEEQEQRAVALAKLGFYQQLFTAGQLLTFIGLLGLVVGVLQLRPRRIDPASDLPVSR
jgi:hypothetical protein